MKHSHIDVVLLELCAEEGLDMSPLSTNSYFKIFILMILFNMYFYSNGIYTIRAVAKLSLYSSTTVVLVGL